MYLYSDHPGYRNDIAEEIRLFFGQIEILFADTLPEDTADTIMARLSCEGRMLTATAAYGTSQYTEAMRLPQEVNPIIRKRYEKRAVKVAVFRLLKSLYPIATPWGSLTGIRPTKLFRELSRQEGRDGARAKFTELFDVSEEKQRLAERICTVQEPILASQQPSDVDIYVDIPFCKTKCLYCSFPSKILKDEKELEPYLATLFKELASGAALAHSLGYHVRSTYLGGGTPTVLSAVQLGHLLETIHGHFGSFGGEITVEAGRPDTITREKLQVLHDAGVGRISINPQTMNDETLSRIGRAHTAADICETFALAKTAGFPVVNMDLIAGLPGEDAAVFADTLRKVEALHPENLTVHTLALKRSSRLWDSQAEFTLPNAEEVEHMVALGAASAERMGMQPYYMYRQKYMNGNLENVGYAAPDSVCVYNIDMMEETTNILAHGAGAMTKRVFGGENRVERIPNPKDITTYTEKLPLILAEKRRLFD